jgi:hypothetical protein
VDTSMETDRWVVIVFWLACTDFCRGFGPFSGPYAMKVADRLNATNKFRGVPVRMNYINEPFFGVRVDGEMKLSIPEATSLKR